MENKNEKQQQNGTSGTSGTTGALFDSIFAAVKIDGGEKAGASAEAEPIPPRDRIVFASEMALFVMNAAPGDSSGMQFIEAIEHAQLAAGNFHAAGLAECYQVFLDARRLFLERVADALAAKTK